MAEFERITRYIEIFARQAGDIPAHELSDYEPDKGGDGSEWSAKRWPDSVVANFICDFYAVEEAHPELECGQYGESIDNGQMEGENWRERYGNLPLKTLFHFLTFFVRGERWSGPGFIEEGLRKQRIQTILSRIRDIDDQGLSCMPRRAKECLLGQLVGDAFGSPVEFMTRREIRRAYPGGLRDMVGGGYWGLAPGQPTDDSEMALALARGILENGGRYDARTVRARYLEWIRSPGSFGIGGTIGPALLAGWRNGRSQANGALMRVSPLGIWGAVRDRALLHRCAVADARLTHANPLVDEVNQIFASLIAEAVATGKKGEELYEDMLSRPGRYVASGTYSPEIERWIRAAARPKKVAIDNEHRGWVVFAFWNALYQMLHADDFAEALIETVNAGGDTDTNAAICGALMGAVSGKGEIPRSWRTSVLECRPERGRTRKPRPQAFWPTDVLDIAEALLQGDAPDR